MEWLEMSKKSREDSVFMQAWKHVVDEGIFSLFALPIKDWQQITTKIIHIAERLEDTSGLLSALFQISGITIPLQLNNDPENKTQQYWLKLVEQAKAIAAHCMTEPNVGTDVFAMETRAQAHDGGWILNGSKTYICNAPVADVGLVYARIDGLKKSSPYSLGCFLVDMKAPGVCRGPELKKIGLNNIPMATIHFQNVDLSNEHLIARGTQAYQMVHMALTYERLLIPIAFIGIMKRIYLHSNSSSKVEIYKNIFMCESLLQTVLGQIDLRRWQRKYIKLGCLLKWQLSEMYIETARLSGDEEIYCDALSSWIYSGTNDVLKASLEQLL